jgi:antitoxin (DNA-binding transcriptional repressor) of toxin-antitoxin stability system
MNTTIDIRELPARLAEAVALASSGVEVILTEGEIPRLRLVSCETAVPRVPGLHPGSIEIAPDFDVPLPDEFWAGHP